MGNMHGKYWIRMEGAYCVVVACVIALVQFVSKYIVGTNDDFKHHSGKCVCMCEIFSFIFFFLGGDDLVENN